MSRDLAREPVVQLAVEPGERFVEQQHRRRVARATGPARPACARRPTSRRCGGRRTRRARRAPAARSTRSRRGPAGTPPHPQPERRRCRRPSRWGNSCSSWNTMPIDRRWVGSVGDVDARRARSCRRRVRRCRRSRAAACSCRCPTARAARRSRRARPAATPRRAPAARRTAPSRHGRRARSPPPSSPPASTSTATTTAIVSAARIVAIANAWAWNTCAGAAEQPLDGDRQRLAARSATGSSWPRTRRARSRRRCRRPTRAAAAGTAAWSSPRPAPATRRASPRRARRSGSMLRSTPQPGAHHERDGHERVADRHQPPRRAPVDRVDVERDQHAEPDRHRGGAERQHQTRCRAARPDAAERSDRDDRGAADQRPRTASPTRPS